LPSEEEEGVGKECTGKEVGGLSRPTSRGIASVSVNEDSGDPRLVVFGKEVRGDSGRSTSIE